MYKDIIYKGESTNYKVDENGNVLSLFSNKILKPKLKKNDYQEYCLYINKEKVNLLAHRIVATAFIDNSDNLETVNNIDGNKANNCKDNLEWCSYSDNEKTCLEK